MKLVQIIFLLVTLLAFPCYAQTTGKICLVGEVCTIPEAQRVKVYIEDVLHAYAEKGRSYTFTSTPKNDSVHVRWAGACASAGANPVCVITINSEARISAVWGFPMTLTAKPDKGSKFVKWTGNYCNGSTNPECKFVMEGSYDGQTTDIKMNAQFDKMPKPVWRR